MKYAIALLVMLTLPANATLESRLGGVAVYDTDINVTWLADANLAASRTFGVQEVGGIMDQGTAREWIAAMNAADYLGVSDWRGPGALPAVARCVPDAFWGEVCIAAEMQHMYYDNLGGTGTHLNLETGIGLIGDSKTGTQGPFYNIASSYLIEVPAQGDSGIAVISLAFGGFTEPEDGNVRSHLWALTSGDPFGAVSEPSLLALIVAGLLGCVSRRKSTKRY